MPDDRRSVGVRVRPNSHDFIRLLRQELAAKKYTHYVNVGANTTQATKDVRAWAAGPLQKIHASVPVRANTGPATRDMADWRRRQAGISTTVKVHADTSAAVREISALEAMAKDITVRVKADTARARESAARAGTRSAGRSSAASDIDREFQAALKKGVADAHSRLAEIRSAAKKPVEIKLEFDPAADYKLRTRLAKLEQTAKSSPIKTPIEVETADAERQLLALKIQEKAKKLSLPARFDPTDIKQMRAELALLRIREEAKEIQLKVNVSRSSFERIKDAQERIGKQFGNFSLIRSLDVGPLNLGKPTGLVGTVSTLTILAGLLPGAVAGTTALADGMTRLAGAAALVPGAIGALAASLGTLTIGTKGISDAFDSMFAMWDEGASQQGKAATKLVSAQNNYKNAVVDEQRAQERVGEARRSALSDLRDLNNELRGGVLNEAQAMLDLQKAKDRYAQGDFENNTDRLQGLLDIQRAQLNLDTTREGNLNLQQKANDANAKGVEGSDAVRDALDAQRRAADGVTQALEALNAGGAGATTAAQKFQDQLSQLSPNAQDFVMTIAGFKDEMYGFRNAIQDTIFQGAGPAFADMFNDMLPVIQPGMQKIAEGLNSNLLQVFDTIKSPEGQSIIERILGGTAETQEAISHLIDPAVRGIGTLVAAGTEHMPQLIDLFTNLAERFATFIEKADKDGTLDTFLDKGIGALADMAEIGLNLIQIVNDLSKAFGGNILTDIKNITDKWHEFLSSEEGQAKLKAFLQEAKDLWAEWKPVIMEIPGAFAAVSEAAKNVLGFILPAAENILGFLNQFPGAIELIATALITSKLLGSFSTLAKTVGAIFSALGGMPALISRIPAIPGIPYGGQQPGVPGATGALGTASTALGAAAVPLAIGGYVADQASDAGVNPLGAAGAGGAAAGLSFTPLVAALPLLMRDPKFARDTFGNADLNAKQQLLDAIWKKFEDSGKKDEDAVKLYGTGASGKMSREDLENLARIQSGVPSFMAGGYTDWGAKQGRIIEAHGGEYIEPKPTVDHYGVDAMRAVHNKSAVISYAGGGPVPMAYPGNDQVPYGGVGGVGGGLGWYLPGVGFIPGAEGDLGPSKSPFRGKDTRPEWKRRGSGPFGGGAPGPIIIPRSYESGGLVFDPLTGQYVQTGAAVSHGVNPATQGSPGILDTAISGVTQGVSHAANVGLQVASTVQGLATQAAGSPAGTTADAAVSPFGVTGAAPGPAVAPTEAAAPGLGSFGDSFLGALGIPGLGGDQQQSTGPGWGPGGPPIGLGGGEGTYDAQGKYVPPFDIRKFGIGPGPLGSGPADWAKFTGETLGKFGSGLLTTFASGALDFVGLGGLMGYIQTGGGVAGHFAGAAGEKSKAQGPGAAQTDADVNALLGIENMMPSNPAYPGAPSLPAPFDPATGTAVPGGGGNGGLQVNTARGKAAIQQRFPWATNIGGVRADALKWHPSGLALDVMIPGAGGLNDPTPPKGKAMGDQLYSWLMANKAALGIDYILWQEKDHFNHLHVNFAASGYAPGNGPPAALTNPGQQIGVISGSPGQKGIVSGPNVRRWKPKQGASQPGGSLIGPAGGNPPPGTTMWDVPSFAAGGFNTAVVPFKPIPPAPAPITRPPNVITKTPPVAATPKPPAVAPKPAVPAAPTAPPPVATAPHTGAGAPPGPAAPAPQGPSAAPITTGSQRSATGAGPGTESMDHVHPALRKGITSGFAAAGQAASTAIAIAASLAAGAGSSGFSPGASAVGALGAIGPYVQGLFMQGGKIANNAANVASSFLVGNITGGSTENPYGVTQRGSVPTGGNRVVDASNNQYGDVYTNNLEEYRKMIERKENQKAQADLGRWGSQV